MSTPVKNNQTPPPPANDPYSKSYGDPYGNQYGEGYDPGMGQGAPPSGDMQTDSYENGDYGDYGDFSDFLGGEDDFGIEGGEEGSGAPQSQATEASVRSMLQDLQGTLSESEYKAFQGRINATAGMSPEKAQNELNKIAADLYNLANPPAEGEVGPDGEVVEDDPNVEVKKEIETLLEGVKANDELSSEQKDEFEDELKKLINGLELGTMDADSVMTRFEELKEEIAQASAFPPAVQSLAQLTGKSPEELDAMFEKYGLDPKNLPNPPDSKVAAMLNDPSFSDSLTALKNGVKEAEGKILDEYEKLKVDCANENAQREAHTSGWGYNEEPFKHMLELKNGTHSVSEQLVSARNKLATEVGSILTAMYGGDVSISALSDSAKAGSISFNGTELNICGDSATGDVTFGTDTAIDWPTIDLVPYGVDCEGDGARSASGWAKDAGFPVYSYDGGADWGSRST